MIIIIGGGIAGLTAAYYCEKQDLEYRLITKDIGGRIFTISIDSEDETVSHDMGAEYFLDRDTHLLNLINELGLNIEEYLPARSIFHPPTGKSLIFPRSEDGILTKLVKTLRTLTYVGLNNFRSASAIRSKIKEWDLYIKKLYDHFDNTDITDIFAPFTNDFKHLYSLTLEEFLVSEGFSEEFIYKMVDPLFHAIYMISADELNAAIGVMGFAAKNSKVYRVENGNEAIIRTLLQHISPENLIMSTVEAIEETGEGYFVHTATGSHKASHIFAACPGKDLRHLQYVNFSSDKEAIKNSILTIPYNNTVYHHLIYANPTPLIQEFIQKNIDTIYLAEASDIMEINIVLAQDDQCIFDITANREISSCSTNAYFDEIEVIKSIHWDPSYPYYNPATMNKFEQTNLVSTNLYLGTDSYISTMGSSVLIAKKVIEKFGQFGPSSTQVGSQQEFHSNIIAP